MTKHTSQQFFSVFLSFRPDFLLKDTRHPLCNASATRRYIAAERGRRRRQRPRRALYSTVAREKIPTSFGRSESPLFFSRRRYTQDTKRRYNIPIDLNSKFALEYRFENGE